METMAVMIKDDESFNAGIRQLWQYLLKGWFTPVLHFHNSNQDSGTTSRTFSRRMTRGTVHTPSHRSDDEQLAFRKCV